ncbi:tumor necrosis factor alpha-induced protein 8-like protein 1 isoform X1 [Convolutriloba macropyga]|uniref:tumor necrosis factor alpha-induced protein 8-like protein 1 isoform X1 n=1 Tax=Convolutriloba macropyga TaxID=536237 RepID=UPI003F520033
MSKDKDNANDGDGSSSGGNKSEMSLRAQKNLIPKLITPVFVRQFLGDKESAVLELWEKMTMELERGRHLRAHGVIGQLVSDLWSSEKKVVEKRFKRTYKIVIKLGILLKNDVITQEEKQHLDRLTQHLEMIAEITVKTFRDKVPYDYEMISGLVHTVGEEANAVLCNHMTTKNLNKLSGIVQYFEGRDFLDLAYDKTLSHNTIMASIVDNLADLMCLY